MSASSEFETAATAISVVQSVLSELRRPWRAFVLKTVIAGEELESAIARGDVGVTKFPVVAAPSAAALVAPLPPAEPEPVDPEPPFEPPLAPVPVVVAAPAAVPVVAVLSKSDVAAQTAAFITEQGGATSRQVSVHFVISPSAALMRLAKAMDAGLIKLKEPGRAGSRFYSPVYVPAAETAEEDRLKTLAAGVEKLGRAANSVSIAQYLGRSAPLVKTDLELLVARGLIRRFGGDQGDVYGLQAESSVEEGAST